MENVNILRTWENTFTNLHQSYTTELQYCTISYQCHFTISSPKILNRF